ncbi:hypothetical protein SAMN04489732_10857 [Amycolatopsis saalfeldensis]|uniref:Uncharacterized protein n=1 Tax=Amycolatopsis saalfeldensis TaxID=394193 RepID=A0A1H8XNJ2_9PSEU|nr:hypothetical protein SAMN04489732_10857 [Amycolatopsis saalfeldensis]
MAAPKSTSSRTTTSGRHSRAIASSAAARSRPPRRANSSFSSQSSRAGSTGGIGTRTGLAGSTSGAGLVAIAVNPARSIDGTSRPAPATATVCPASAAARATGAIGSKCPRPPAKVKRKRIPGKVVDGGVTSGTLFRAPDVTHPWTGRQTGPHTRPG